MAAVLVIGDACGTLDERRLETGGHRCCTASSAALALELATRHHFDLIVVGAPMDDHGELELLPRLSRIQPHSTVIMVTPRAIGDTVAQVVAQYTDRRAAGSGARVRVSRALDLIATRYQELGYSARTIAQTIGVSEEYLCRLVKKQTGRTIGALVHHQRVHEAGRLLLTTSLTVKEVAFTVGYNGTGHLERHFKRAFHCTPIAYRQSVSGATRQSRSDDGMSIAADASSLPRRERPR